jgi:ssDNA-binding Zn-finger/Zn-ribbon topoisomerase 1
MADILYGPLPTYESDRQGMDKMIRGESRAFYGDPKYSSWPIVSKSGKIRIHHRDYPSCRNLWWQKANYERCPKLGDGA